MPTFIFDKCCGCIELRTGCLIIGYLQLVGEIIMSAMLLVTLALGGALVASDNPDNQKGGTFIIVLSALLLIFLILALAFTIALLVGIHKNKRGHVKAYLIYAVIFFVIGVILFFASFANSPIKAQNVFSNLFSLLLNLYFILVIRSHYIKMGDSSKGPAVYNTA